MSYVITIKRPVGKPLLTTADITEMVEADPSLSGGKLEPILWTDPADGQNRYLNIEPEAGQLWTDDLPKDEPGLNRFLDKLRNIAGKLDAHVYGEEGEDITKPPPNLSTKTGCAAVIVCMAAFFAVLVMLIGSGPATPRQNGSADWQPDKFRPREVRPLPTAASLETEHNQWLTENTNSISRIYTAMLGNPAQQGQLMVEYKEMEGPLGRPWFTFASYRYHDPANGTYIITWSSMGRHKPKFMKLEATPRLHWLAPTLTGESLELREGIPVLRIVGVEGVPKFCAD